MVRLYMILIVSFVTFTVLSSCSKTWEDEPLERFTDEYVWDVHDSLGQKAGDFLNQIYSYLPQGFTRLDGNYLDAATDDAISSQPGGAVEVMASGGISPFNNPDDNWGKMYTGIRAASLFINNIDKVPLSIKLPDGRSMRPVWKAEARFLRAFFYFELMKRYGGVPLMGDKVLQSDDNVQIPRSSFKRTVDYIVQQCELAIDSLRPDPVDMINLGRATKVAAMALKARTLLYAASPLYNGENIAAGDSLSGYIDKDPERWHNAAVAAGDIINLGVYSLDADFRDVFITAGNSETIFARNAGDYHQMEDDNSPIGYSGTSAYANGRTSPTEELVDAFPMANGLPITDINSGYDSTNPYFQRDPRLYYTVFCNGTDWLGRPVETFNDGLDRPGTDKVQTLTGYYAKKFMGKFETSTSYANEHQTFIYFRYAEVLLNYAEAENEYEGPVGSVYTAIESVRQRAGLNPYKLPADLNKDQMRAIIHNERRIEMAFEEQRYWDIRRWKIADSVMNQPFHGIEIIRSSSGALTYTIVPVFSPRFTAPYQYLYPISYNEVASNEQMKQNPGWK